MITQIGRYQVQAELGRGGFGRVFRAYDPTVGRLVAVKTLTASDEPEMVKRFRNEAAAAGKLRHPNIVVIYDFGEQDGSPFLVMELLEGEDVERIIANRRGLSLWKRLDIMLQAADGLHHAHTKGIVHRDIKPANIMLLSDGSVKILDFGIALLSQATSARLTPQGSAIGTLPYMAPEQLRGAASNQLTDIFAYGITLHRLLTGTHPFDAADVGGLMYNIMNQRPPSVREVCPDAPEALETLIGRLLEKDCEARYQTLEDVRLDLEPIVLALRKENVGGLLAQARNLVAANQLDTAQSVVRQAIEIDPDNRTARELRERLQRQIKDREVRPRVASLVGSGREELDARQFDGAIQKFESALRLDKSNAQVRALIDQARAEWEQANRAERLLDDARRARSNDDLSSAHRILGEALSVDPRNPRTPALLETVRKEIEARRNRERLRDGLTRVKTLILSGSHTEAIQAAAALREEHPQSKEAEQLLGNALQEREAQERRRRLQAGIAGAKELLRNQRFAEASKRLTQLLAEFPDTIELRELTSHAAEGLRTQKEAEVVARATADTQRLLASGDFDGALEHLRNVLTEYPGLSPLRDLLQSVASQQADHQRKMAMIDVLRKGVALAAESRFAETITQIGAFVTAYGNSAALDDLQNEAEEGLERQRRAAAVRNLCLEAERLLDAAEPRAAIAVLEQGIAQFPGDPELTASLSAAKHNLRMREQMRTTEIRHLEEQPVMSSTAADSRGARRMPTVKVLVGSFAAVAVIAAIALAPRWSSHRRVAPVPAEIRTAPVASPVQQPLPVPTPPAPTESRPATGTRVVQATPPDTRTHEAAARPESRRAPSGTAMPATSKPPGPADAPPAIAPPAPADNADSIDTRDWERARNSTDPPQLHDYLRTHPNSPHTREAELRIADLIWNSVDAANIEAVRKFARENPGNPHKAEAQTILDQYLAEQQRTAQESARLELTRQAQTNQVREKDNLRRQQVLDTLKQFDSALQRKRVRDVKAIWPTATQLFLDALANSHVKMSLVLKAEDIRVSEGADRMLAQCDLVTSIDAGQRHQKATLTLRNAAGGWTIEAAKFD